MRNYGAILILAVAALRPPCAHASFAVTGATTTVEVPPEGNPTYHVGDYLAQQSDHTIKVKKVDNVGAAFFRWRARNFNTCNEAMQIWTSDPLGANWSVGEEHQFTYSDLTVTGVLEIAGGFAVNSYTLFKQGGGPGEFSIEANDSNAFTVT